MSSILYYMGDRQSLLAQQVATSAMLLDQEQPGWHDKIDADALNVACCENCVVAQLYDGNYNKIIGQLGGVFEDPIDAGVYVPGDPAHVVVMTQYEELTRLWRDEVLKRQFAEEISTQRGLVAA